MKHPNCGWNSIKHKKQTTTTTKTDKEEEMTNNDVWHKGIYGTWYCSFS